MATRDRIIDLADFSKGFTALEDTTKSPFGSFRRMRNAQITDRGGIGPRPGTILVGTKNTSQFAIKGLYTYKKSFEANEILLKAYDDELEGFSKNHTDQEWFRIKNGFTQDKEFGFVHSLYNLDNEDILVGSNRYEPFFTYTGAILTLNGALTGGESSLTVDTVLRDDIYESQTATSSSTTTLTVSSVTWATDQWNTFYVYITSGTESGTISKITDTTTDTITFDTISDPGNCTFEIRRLLIPESGTVIYNGTTIAYTAIPTATSLTVSNAHAADDSTIVTLVPTEYEANPRGNRFANYLGRLLVGNVRSALSRDASGNKQGYASGSSCFVSKLNNPRDFDFSGTRVAGEGDIIATPYGGGDITDVVAQEDAAYIFKGDYIEAIKYSQDANDLAVREPLKTGIGSIGKVTETADDVFFITSGKQFTSLGRVRAKDIRPQTMNIGNKIKRWLERSDPDSIGRGISKAGKVYIPMKSRTALATNDVVLVYNINNSSFEGIWDIGAFGIVEFNEKYYYGESTGANVFEMFTNRFADIEGDTPYGYSFDVATHFFNLTSSKSNQQAMYGLVVEGYIRGGTTIDYKIWKDFAENPTVSFSFAANEDAYLDGKKSQFFYGDNPMGVNSLTVDYSDIDNDGRRHFRVHTYFPYTYGNYFSVGIQSSGVDQDHETTRFGLMIEQEPVVNTNRIKSV